MDVIVKGLSKRYGDKVVFSDFSAVFKEGKVTCVLGKSGVGKTTLLNCIAKILPFEGEISGVDGASFVFQEDRLLSNLTVYDNLAFAVKCDKNKIKEALASVDLIDKATSYPDELSGGQKKRVSLARAFLSDKKLILLDEPTNSLDVGLKYKTYKLFVELMEKYGRTAIYVTHDIDEALTVADEIYLINQSGVCYSAEIKGDKDQRRASAPQNLSVREKLMEYLV